MSYPDDRYLGEHGTVSAVRRTPDRPPELVLDTSTASYLATGASTGGRFGLYRWDMAAGHGGARPHFHRSMSESFFVLSGRVELFDGDHWADATAGHFVFVPEGGVHAFRNESGHPASMLILFAPGAPRETYFEGLAELGRLDEAERAAFFARHDTYWV